MKTFITCVFILLFVAFISISIYTKKYSLPNSRVAFLNVSGKSKNDVIQLLENVESKTFQVKIKNRVYRYSYNSLGIVLDKSVVINKLFEHTQKPFLSRMYLLSRSFMIPNKYYPSLLFTQNFNDKMRNTVYDFSLQRDEIKFDSKKETLEYKQFEDKYKIDSSHFKLQLLLSFGQKEPILIPKTLASNVNSTQKVISHANMNLPNAIDQPITIAIQDKMKTHPITLEPHVLKSVLGVSFRKDENRVEFSVNNNELKKYVQEKNKDVQFETAEKHLDFQKLSETLSNLVINRLKGEEINSFIAPVQYAANTKGELAKKYIEIDLSEQMMFRWENGQQIASHVVSTGYWFKTPPGTYKILNKAVNAYSDIYNVWMPYWMAFSYQNSVGAYLGIHELPYWIARDGKEMRRPRDFLGTPRTGGCVSLDIGIAKQVYDWSDIGTPVYVYN